MKRVLIVDDMVFMRFALKGMLTKNGFEVVGEAENGALGVEKYKEYSPDIVTMDITMPVMTGLEALQEIIKYDPRARIVMVSAMGQERFVKEAILYGAKYFIVKPFKEEQVLETIKKVAAL